MVCMFCCFFHEVISGTTEPIIKILSSLEIDIIPVTGYFFPENKT